MVRGAIFVERGDDGEERVGSQEEQGSGGDWRRTGRSVVGITPVAAEAGPYNVNGNINGDNNVNDNGNATAKAASSRRTPK
jgi:hypothetical protein